MKYALDLRRLCITGVLVLAVCMFCACDSAARLMIENHSDEPITVDFLLSHVEVDSCTAHFYGFILVATPPPGLPWFSYTAMDTAGTLLAKGNVRVPRQTGRLGGRWSVIRFPARGSAGCPGPVNRRIKVSITNDTDERIPVYLDKIALGEMEPGEELLVGPLRRQLRDFPRPRVPDDEGEDRLHGWPDLTWDYSIPPYRIGDVPTVYLTIERAKTRY